jgi:hypothetical protein
MPLHRSADGAGNNERVSIGACSQVSELTFAGSDPVPDIRNRNAILQLSDRGVVVDIENLGHNF